MKVRAPSSLFSLRPRAPPELHTRLHTPSHSHINKAPPRRASCTHRPHSSLCKHTPNSQTRMQAAQGLVSQAFPAPEPRIAPHTHLLSCSSLLCLAGFPDFPAVRPSSPPGKAAVILLGKCVIRTCHKHSGGLHVPVLPRPGHDGAGKEAGSVSCFWKLRNSCFPSSHPRRSQRGLWIITPSSLPLTPGGRFSRPCRGGSSMRLFHAAGPYPSPPIARASRPGQGTRQTTDHRQDYKKKNASGMCHASRCPDSAPAARGLMGAGSQG